MLTSELSGWPEAFATPGCLAPSPPTRPSGQGRRDRGVGAHTLPQHCTRGKVAPGAGARAGTSPPSLLDCHLFTCLNSLSTKVKIATGLQVVSGQSSNGGASRGVLNNWFLVRPSRQRIMLEDTDCVQCGRMLPDLLIISPQAAHLWLLQNCNIAILPF